MRNIPKEIFKPRGYWFFDTRSGLMGGIVTGIFFWLAYCAAVIILLFLVVRP